MTTRPNGSSRRPPVQAAPSDDPYDGWVTVDGPTMDRVEDMATLLGARPADTWDQRRDVAAAVGLRRVLPRIAASVEAVEDEDEAADLDDETRELLDHALSRPRAELDRAAREVVTKLWERPRHRLGGHRRLSDNLTYGMAWSPAARALVLPTGSGRPETPAGRVELEHVVPASTITKVVAAMVEKGRSPTDTAHALRTCSHLVVVARKPANGGREQPFSKLMSPAMETKLVEHCTGERLLASPAEVFTVVWSRYLDPVQRGDHTTQQLAWELSDLRTLG